MDERFLNHLCSTYQLTPQDAQRLHEEFLSWHGTTLLAFANRRHAELKRRGWKNDRIFVQIVSEIAKRRFAADPLTIRQLRRRIYG
jgi:hypothetical protein